LGSVLDDVGGEAWFDAGCNGLLVGVAAGVGGDEDEGLVAQAGGGDGFEAGERVGCGDDGDEGFREEDLGFEAGDGVAVAEEASVE